MPAIDPSRLEQQIARVTEVFGDPARLRSRCLDLLEFYASRIRPNYSVGRTGTVRSLGVPAPVMRRLEQALGEKAIADSYAGAMAAEILWATPVMETRWLAIGLTEHQPLTSLPDWIAAWSQSAEDPQLLERLAAGPMRRLRDGDPELFWRTEAAHLSYQDSASTVALVALQQTIPALEADGLPRVFALLGSTPVPTAGESWRAYLEVLKAAAHRSSPETARFLVDEIEHARPGATRVARQLLADFPPSQRSAVRDALRLSEMA
jgi:hypothetical protein